ncbi:MAG: TPM domain-containing protein [Alphaproteobacteria bacterium]|nr:TPM domain-containing protein [Alphaproteobacteria bacterium]
MAASLRVRSRVLGPLMLLLALLCAGAAGYATLTFPPLTGRVVDEANVLSDDTKARLTAMLAQLEQKTGDQVVVATLKSLQGQDIAAYGYQLGRAWGIGQKKTNNGAILIVAPNEHKVRIEVGYGLEGTLTDALSRIIIENAILPQFRAGNVDAGVEQGTVEIVRLLGGGRVDLSKEPEAPQPQHEDHGGIPWVVIAFILVWIIFGRGFWPLFFLGGLGRRSGWGGGGGWSGGGWSGGGGGGFSGGGGSFGGGGASGSW